MILKDDEYNELWEWCRSYIDKNCIWRANKHLLRVPGKEKDTWDTSQFYLKRGLFCPDFSSAISQLMLHRIGIEYGSYEFQIAGVETGSTPLLISIPLIAKVYGLDINAFSIRKSQRAYGLYEHLEGQTNDKPVLLLDDLCLSTQSLRKGFDVLVQTGCPKILDTPFVMVVDNKEVEVSKSIADEKEHLPPHMNVIGIYNMDDFDLPPEVEDVVVKEKEKDNK